MRERKRERERGGGGSHVPKTRRRLLRVAKFEEWLGLLFQFLFLEKVIRNFGANTFNRSSNSSFDGSVCLTG
jgi:hypothetical protein